MAYSDKAKELLGYLDNPNVQAFLDTIADAEGARHGYHTMFGGTKIANLDKHPGKSVPFTTTTGAKKRSTAAGRYQFTKGTWQSLADMLNLEDFSQTSQDLGALELMREQGVLDAVAEGKFDKAFAELGDIWASLPSSTYDQPHRSETFIDTTMATNLAERLKQSALGVIDRQKAPPPSGFKLEELPDLQQFIVDNGTFTPGMQQLQDSVAPSSILTGAEPSGEPVSGLQQLVNAQQNVIGEQPMPTVELDLLHDRLLAAVLKDNANSVRKDIEDEFLGEEPTPDINLPKPLESAINRAIGIL